MQSARCSEEYSAERACVTRRARVVPFVIYRLRLIFFIFFSFVGFVVVMRACDAFDGACAKMLPYLPRFIFVYFCERHARFFFFLFFFRFADITLFFS